MVVNIPGLVSLCSLSTCIKYMVATVIKPWAKCWMGVVVKYSHGTFGSRLNNPQAQPHEITHWIVYIACWLIFTWKCQSLFSKFHLTKLVETSKSPWWNKPVHFECSQPGELFKIYLIVSRSPVKTFDLCKTWSMCLCDENSSVYKCSFIFLQNFSF